MRERKAYYAAAIDDAALPFDPKKPSSPFWLVFNPARSAPKLQHPSEAAARIEADRLAQANPAEEFYVLKAVSRHRIETFTRHDIQSYA